MHVLIFHPSLLPPKDYGGVERVVLWLAKGLLELGHVVSIAAYDGSQLPKGARLVSVSREDPSPLSFVSRLPPDVDVVHFMAPPGESVISGMKRPYLLTVHGNGKAGEIFPKNSVFLSRNHAERHGAEVFVYNGVDPAEFVFEPGSKGNRFLFLSKTSWKVKNVAGAIRLCARARVPLDVAGGSRPLLQRLRTYCHPKMTWHGPVAGRRKAALLARARALLFPVVWPEPFGLVMVEALMSGTPVIGAPFGSIPEIITPDVGAVSGDEREWSGLLRQERLPWSPDQCRQRALSLFHYKKMAEGYETLYRDVILGRTFHHCNPVGRDWRLS